MTKKNKNKEQKTTLGGDRRKNLNSPGHKNAGLDL